MRGSKGCGESCGGWCGSNGGGGINGGRDWDAAVESDLKLLTRREATGSANAIADQLKLDERAPPCKQEPAPHLWTEILSSHETGLKGEKGATHPLRRRW